jgi:hypothetical protein
MVFVVMVLCWHMRLPTPSSMLARLRCAVHAPRISTVAGPSTRLARVTVVRRAPAALLPLVRIASPPPLTGRTPLGREEHSCSMAVGWFSYPRACGYAARWSATLAGRRRAMLLPIARVAPSGGTCDATRAAVVPLTTNTASVAASSAMGPGSKD